MLKSRKPFKKKGPEMKIGILGKLIIVKNVYSVFSPCQLNLYLSFLEAIWSGSTLFSILLVNTYF